MGDYTPTEGPEMKKPLFRNGKEANVIGEMKSQDGGLCLATPSGGMKLVTCDKASKHQQWELNSGSATTATLPITGPAPKKAEELGEETGERSGMVVCLKTNKWHYEGSLKMETGSYISATNGEATASKTEHKWNFAAATGQVKDLSSGKCLHSSDGKSIQIKGCNSGTRLSSGSTRHRPDLSSRNLSLPAHAQ